MRRRQAPSPSLMAANNGYPSRYRFASHAVRLFFLAVLITGRGHASAFVGSSSIQSRSRGIILLPGQEPHTKHQQPQFQQIHQLNAVHTVMADYAPAATLLFNNMKLPAAVVTAGMISLGFATGFPELPADTPERQYEENIRQRCEYVKRLHIVVGLVSVTSELISCLWAAVEVNHLTESIIAPAASVWDLIQRDCDLAWSAVNSHFVSGIIGFVTMLSMRAYVMLLAAEASTALTTAAMTGTSAALCLMISIVNRGVEAGGGEGVGYGKTILDLFQHYGVLLFECAIAPESPGVLEGSAIFLEAISLTFAVQVILFGNDKLPPKEKNEESPVLRTSTDENTMGMAGNYTNAPIMVEEDATANGGASACE